MTVPTEFDWMLVKMGDGEDPEVFTLICGIQDVNVNFTVNSTDRFVRDCAKPGETPNRMTRTNGKQLDITGSGLSNADEVARYLAALGKRKNYKIEGYQDDETDAGVLLGTFAGTFLMTAANISTSRDGDSGAETTLASHGAWTWTPAP